MSVTTLLFGARSGGEVFLSDPGNVHDDGTAVTLRAITATWAPNGWWGEAIWRTVTLVTSANVGGVFQVTPLVDGVAQPVITFTLPTPSAGERTQVRTVIGLSRPVSIGVVQVKKVGLRGTWVQFLVETVGAVTVPSGEVNPDLRVEACEIEVEPMLRSQQVVNAG